MNTSGCFNTSCFDYSDLASAFGTHAKALLQKPFVQALLNEAKRSEDPAVKDTCQWAESEIRKATQ